MIHGNMHTCPVLALPPGFLDSKMAVLNLLVQSHIVFGASWFLQTSRLVVVVASWLCGEMFCYEQKSDGQPGPRPTIHQCRFQVHFKKTILTTIESRFHLHLATLLASA